jgi:hypothetical protein
VAEIPDSDSTLRVQPAKDKVAAGVLYQDEGFGFAPEIRGKPSPVRSATLSPRRGTRKAGIRGVYAMRHPNRSFFRAPKSFRCSNLLLRVEFQVHVSRMLENSNELLACRQSILQTQVLQQTLDDPQIYCGSFCTNRSVFILVTRRHCDDTCKGVPIIYQTSL